MKQSTLYSSIDARTPMTRLAPDKYRTEFKPERALLSIARKNFVAAILCLVPAVVCAQAPSPISTDRPTFTDSASLVPQGRLQFELGSTATSVSGTTTYTYGEMLTRYGFSNRLEFRIANLTWTHVPGQSNGFLDPSAGLKIWLQTGASKRPDLAIELMTTLPAGATQYSVNRSQPTAKLLWNQQIDPNTSVTGNFIVSDLGPNGSRFTQWAESAFVNRAINPKLSLFAEIYRLDPTVYAASGSTSYDLGVTYLLNANLQLDARYGAGFDPQVMGRAVGIGVSYRY